MQTQNLQRFTVQTTPLPLSANNCGFVGSVFGSAASCNISSSTTGATGPTGPAGPIGGLPSQVIYNQTGAATGSANFTFENSVLTVPTLNATSITGPAYSSIRDYNSTSPFMLAGGFPKILQTSVDGITWTRIIPAFLDNFSSIVYSIGFNGSQWIVGGNTGNVNNVPLGYSSDGINFTTCTVNPSLNVFLYYQVAWGGATWVAAVRTTSLNLSLLYSSDGITWLAASGTTPLQYAFCVAYNGTNKWIAGGQRSSATMLTSADGINWSTVATGSALITIVMRAIAYGNGMWIAGGFGTNQIIYSTDNGVSWTASASGNAAFTNGCFALAYNGSMWVAGGSSPAGSLAYSYDGITYTSVAGSNSFFTTCNSIAWNGKVWVAVGQSGGSLAYSYDGINWVSASSSLTSGFAVASSYVLPNVYSQNVATYSSNYVPSSTSSSGFRGTFAFDNTYLYLCTATNTWKRVQWSAF